MTTFFAATAEHPEVPPELMGLLAFAVLVIALLAVTGIGSGRPHS